MVNCVSFRARSSYAKFRKAYTTTSTLTYLLAPPTIVRGLIGAILGVDRIDLHKKTDCIDIAIEVLNDINKDTQSFNLSIMNNEAGNSYSYPSNIEFLRDVEYRVYVKTDSRELLDKIKEVLTSGEYFYMPYLGSAEHACKLIYEGEFEAVKLEKGSYPVSSAFDKKTASKIQLDDVKIYADNIPVRSSEYREYIEYKKIMFPVEQYTILVESDNLYRIGDKNVEFI